MTRYRTIVADPPWPIAWQREGIEMRRGGWQNKLRPTRVYAQAYPTMSVGDIAALPVAGFAEDDALLFMWATRRLFREGEAARVARAWGFEPFAEIIWGLRNPGLGGAAGNDHEPVLIARRGSIALDETKALGVRFWRQPYSSGGKIHSAKPDGFLDLVEAVAPGPYLELFARRQRLGWDTWGNEALNHVELAS